MERAVVLLIVLLWPTAFASAISGTSKEEKAIKNAEGNKISGITIP